MLLYIPATLCLCRTFPVAPLNLQMTVLYAVECSILYSFALLNLCFCFWCCTPCDCVANLDFISEWITISTCFNRWTSITNDWNGCALPRSAFQFSKYSASSFKSWEKNWLEGTAIFAEIFLPLFLSDYNFSRFFVWFKNLVFSFIEWFASVVLLYSCLLIIVCSFS